jgi:hypothetical protein
MTLREEVVTTGTGKKAIKRIVTNANSTVGRACVCLHCGRLGSTHVGTAPHFCRDYDTEKALTTVFRAVIYIPLPEEMPAESGRILALLKAHGAVLARSKRHRVWQFPDGRVFALASTPSDHRAEANQYADLRKLLGLSGGGAEGARRERKAKHPRQSRGVAAPAASAVDIRDIQSELFKRLYPDWLLEEARRVLGDARLVTKTRIKNGGH